MDSKLTMLAESFYIPKIEPLGEDAHFICKEAQVIGVADGVGAWSVKRGIDVGEHARQLMKNAEEYVRNSLPAAVDPKSILANAFENTKLPGASTACILQLDGNRLRGANVGDSGFAVIREGTTIFRSPVQQHSFNHPYQLGTTADSPNEAEEMVVDLESGDVVVAGTDGLFDNMFLEDIEQTVEWCLTNEVRPGEMARKMAEKTRRKSLMRKRACPFTFAAGEAGLIYLGGKPDDITIVVAYVSKLEPTLAIESDNLIEVLVNRLVPTIDS